MLSSGGFDLWADGYDESVALSEEENTYPFAGYRQVLGLIYKTVRRSSGNRVLDLGFGTGVLTQALYRDGYTVCGVDFSQRMIDIAREKMPSATLIQHDFSQGLPPALEGERFDFILCTYAIHHLDDQGKAALIRQCLSHLTPQGMILIGDVAFETGSQLQACRVRSGEEWDDEEFYMVKEALSPLIPHLEFVPISFCSGVFFIKP